MHPIDLSIVVIYAAGLICLGKYLTTRRTTVQDYFLAGRALPWWTVMLSIVATEKSTITLKYPRLFIYKRFQFSADRLWLCDRKTHH